MFKRYLPVVTLALAATVAACAKKDESPATTQESAAAPAAAAPSAGGEQTPDQGRKVIEVLATTDDQGNNRFIPADLEAHKGDVIRFKLGTGVHNVHFLPDSNPGKNGLPPASDFLQLPGQTYDLKVTLGEGKYYLQCDPHAALGMKGHLEVED